MGLKLTAISVILVTMVLVSSSFVGATWPPSTFKTGDEKDKLNGHTFKEEYWTTDISNTSADGTVNTFTASYVNDMNVQALLIAFKTSVKDNKTSTLPYQFFGMHYYTPGGREVFLGAVLAFLMAYNDTWNESAQGAGQDGIPEPNHENVYYIFPFGVGDTNQFKGNNSYVPQVSAISVNKIADGEYEFGMTYTNLYAKIIDGNSKVGFLLSALLPLYIAKFSELTVKYHVKMDKANKKITSETHYTLGQVQKLWLFGKSVNPKLIPSNWGIAAVHYAAMFMTGYKTEDNANQSVGNLQAGLSQKTAGIHVDADGKERAFEVGFRGTYDLIDENNNNQVVKANQPAINLLVGARPVDTWLVGIQANLSLGFMGIFAYAMSAHLRTLYTSPYDLVHKGADQFLAGAFWYAVCFPGWGSYRVVHDPVYTGYTNFASGPTTTTTKKACGGSIILLGVCVAGVSGASGYGIRRKRSKN